MIVRVVEHVAWREIAGETFVIDLKARRMYGLNAIGGQVWKALDERRDVADIARLLTPSSTDNGHVNQALQSFFVELRDLGLVSCHQLDQPSPEMRVELPETYTPPRVVWQEELRAFGFSCALQPSTTPTCNQIPTT
jgi:hypothetical protein